MIGVLGGFGLVGIIIVVGMALGRTGLLGPDAQQVLTRLAFFIATPALLLTTVGQAHIGDVLGEAFLVQSVTAAIIAAIFMVIGRLAWGLTGTSLFIGGMSASYVNAGNLGIPIAAYALGDSTQIAPIMLFQLALYTPILMILFDLSAGSRRGILKSLAHVVSNPMLIASLIGVTISATGIQLPEFVWAPVDMLADLSVPVMLLSFGFAIGATKPFSGDSNLREVLTASALKIVVHPLLAYGFGVMLGMEPHMLFATVVMAGLPSAQNVFNYSARYHTTVDTMRDTVLLTTIASIPSLLVITALLYA